MSDRPTAAWRGDDVSALVHRVQQRLETAPRLVLGIAGPPGAGKSTLAALLARAFADSAVVVPMDGFHLADAELDRLGRHERKGAADTFDADGFVHLLRRIRDAVDDVVYAPVFDRRQEQAVAGAIAVMRRHPLVIVEGNYLLAGEAFAPVRGLLDECWYVDTAPGVRRRRLVERHIHHGRSATQAQEWVEQTDEVNARVVEATRSLADLIVRRDDDSGKNGRSSP